MTKSETREVNKTLQYGATLGPDYIARVLSMLYRGARTTRSQRAIFEIALEMGVTSNQEFII